MWMTKGVLVAILGREVDLHIKISICFLLYLPAACLPNLFRWVFPWPLLCFFTIGVLAGIIATVASCLLWQLEVPIVPFTKNLWFSLQGRRYSRSKAQSWYDLINSWGYLITIEDEMITYSIRLIRELAGFRVTNLWSRRNNSAGSVYFFTCITRARD